MSYIHTKPFDVPCPECRALVGNGCTTKSGKAAKPHALRKGASGPEQPSVAEQAARPTYQPGQSAQYAPTVSTREARCAVATEDGQRLLRNAAYGIVDDTLDPLDIVRQLLEYPEEVYTVEQWDERQEEHDKEIKDLTKERDDARKDASDEHARRESAEGKIEQAEVDLKTAQEALALAVADVTKWRDRVTEYQRRTLDAEHTVKSSDVVTNRFRRSYAEGECGYA